MNILGNNADKLNDVIFENRNKSYGAYAIRKSYNDSLIKSIVCLSSLIVLVFGSAFLYNKAVKNTSIEKLTVFSDPKLDLIEYTTKVDVTPITEPVKNNLATATAPKGLMATTIIDEVIEPTTQTTLNNIISGTGNETAKGISANGSETSTVTTISIVVATASISSNVVIVADEMPEFEGGVAGLMRYVSQNIVYPSVAREIGKEGIVYVSFVVNENGNVESVKVMRGIGFGCDEEVVRVIGKMPTWKKIGKNAGHPVKVRFNIPVRFKLQ